MTNEEHQVVLGAFFGNGSIITRDNSSYFTFIDNNWCWAEYKASHLKIYAANKPFAQDNKRIRWRSFADPYWHKKHAIWYDNQGIKNVDIVSELKDFGHMIWFGDKGFWASKKKVGLKTTHFGAKNQELKSYFEGLGIGCELRKAGPSWRIVFDEEGTKQYLRMIGHLTPPFMFGKLTPQA